MPVTWVPWGSQASGWSARGVHRPPAQVTPCRDAAAEIGMGDVDPGVQHRHGDAVAVTRQRGGSG